jgi:anti-sigma regulatory factor (Ser/Thr protein kinase)
LAGKIANWLMDFCQMTVADRETTSRLHMAAHELVENVLKYGSSPEVGLEFELERGDELQFVRLKTRNTAAPEQLEEVTRRVTELRAAADPIAYYDRLIRSTAPVLGVSGLGLARIRAEAGLEVDCSVEGREVSITVQATMRSER